ncbi:MAG: sigma-70 family RNA polymerase sigma factor [Planctomycetota bacterium]
MSAESKMNEEILGQPLRELADRGFSVALRLLRHREDAADTVQDALYQLLASRDRFDSSRGTLRGWFLAIVRNRCLDRLKKKQPTQMPDRHEATDNRQVSPDRNLERQELIETVRVAITRMDATSREILLIRDYDGLSYAEISSVLGIPSGTVMSRLHRARRQLKALVDEADSARPHPTPSSDHFSAEETSS